MKILWTEPARMDLREIFLYISNDNPKAARVLLDTIKKRVALLKENRIYFKFQEKTNIKPAWFALFE
jgi:plasmid stabilization system protein ParE